MANEVKNYEVDLSKLTKRVNELRQAESQLAKQQEVLKRALDEGKITQEQYTKTVELNTKQVEANRAELQNMAKILESNKKQLKESAKATEENSVKMKLFGAVLGAIQGTFGQLVNSLDNYRQNAKKFSDEIVAMFKSVSDAEQGVTDALANQQKALQERSDKQILANGTQEEKEKVLKRRMEESKAQIEATTKALEEQDKSVKKALADWNKIKDSNLNTDGVFGGRTKAEISSTYNKALAKQKELIDQQTKAQADYAQAEEDYNKFKQSSIDEQSKKQKEEDERHKKELEKQKQLDEERNKQKVALADQLKDLEIQLIDDVEKRQKASIERDRDRAIRAVNEVKKKFNDPAMTKTIDSIVKKLNEVSFKNLQMVDLNGINDSISKLGVNITELMRESILEMYSEIDPETGRMKYGEQYMKALRANAEEVSKEYLRLNKVLFSNQETYHKFLTKITKNLIEQFSVIPKFNEELEIANKELSGTITKIEASREREDLKKRKSQEAQDKAVEAENKRYNKNVKQAKLVNEAEILRLETIKRQNVEREEGIQNSKKEIELLTKENEILKRRVADVKGKLNEVNNQIQETNGYIQESYVYSSKEMEAKLRQLWKDIGTIKKSKGDDTSIDDVIQLVYGEDIYKKLLKKYEGNLFKVWKEEIAPFLNEFVDAYDKIYSEDSFVYHLMDTKGGFEDSDASRLFSMVKQHQEEFADDMKTQLSTLNSSLDKSNTQLKQNQDKIQELTDKIQQYQSEDIDYDIDQAIKDRKESTEAELNYLKNTHEKSLSNIKQNGVNERLKIEYEYKNEQAKLLNDEVEANRRAEEEKVRIRKEHIEEQLNSYADFTASMGSMMNSLSDVYLTTANDERKSDAERERARKKALHLQEIGIGFSMAESLAGGISKAVSTSSNWIEALAAIIAMVASVTSQFAQIRSLKAEGRNAGNYSTGGYVSGAGSGTSDSIPAHLSNGEYVVNARATANNLPLLDSMNFGNANSLATQFALAVQTIPNPVVSVETIERVTTQKSQIGVYSHL